jgi:hypothetical protein
MFLALDQEAEREDETKRGQTGGDGDEEVHGFSFPL